MHLLCGVPAKGRRAGAKCSTALSGVVLDKKVIGRSLGFGLRTHSKVCYGLPVRVAASLARRPARSLTTTRVAREASASFSEISGAPISHKRFVKPSRYEYPAIAEVPSRHQTIAQVLSLARIAMYLPAAGGLRGSPSQIPPPTRRNGTVR